MQAKTINEIPKTQVAILAKILELSGGRIHTERLSILFLLVQKQILCRFGIIISVNDRFLLGDKKRIELLSKSKSRDSFFNSIFLIKDDVISFTSVGLRSINRTDYDSELAIYGYLCESDYEIIAATVASFSPESKVTAEAEIIQFFGSSNEYQTWHEIINQRKEWDVLNPHLRRYLLENELNKINIESWN